MTTPVSPEIGVGLELDVAADGGRQRPLNEGECLSVFLVGQQGFPIRFFVALPFDAGTLQRLGVQFLFPKEALPHFAVGKSFSIREGRVIGHGRVLEVLAR